MSGNRNQLDHQKVIDLAFAIQRFLEEKNDPFDTWDKAISHFSGSLNFVPTKDNIKTICKKTKNSCAAIVKDKLSSYGSQVTSLFRRVKELESRIEKIENDLK